MFGNTRNVPERVADPRPLPLRLTSQTGDAGRDGYTCLSIADRKTGIRPPAGGGSHVEHDPENACPGLDPGWEPVFGKDHA